MNKLSQEEIQDLVSFTSSENSMYFYSKMTLSKNIMTYNNEEYNIPENILERLQKGLLAYEYYKLSMTRSEAKELITEKATQLIEEQYAERFENMTNLFTTMLEKVDSTLTNATTTINITLAETTNASEQICILTDKLIEMEKTINTKEINNKINQKLNELEEVKNIVLDLVSPVTKQANKLIKNLEQLVDIESI
jgi:hypothetical protein